MNKKAPLKSGLEFDVMFGKKIYCYIKNNPSIVRFAKRGLRRRLRREGKEVIRMFFKEAVCYELDFSK